MRQVKSGLQQFPVSLIDTPYMLQGTYTVTVSIGGVVNTAVTSFPQLTNIPIFKIDVPSPGNLPARATLDVTDGEGINILNLSLNVLPNWLPLDVTPILTGTLSLRPSDLPDFKELVDFVSICELYLYPKLKLEVLQSMAEPPSGLLQLIYTVTALHIADQLPALLMSSEESEGGKYKRVITKGAELDGLKEKLKELAYAQLQALPKDILADGEVYIPDYFTVVTVTPDVITGATS